MAGKGTVVVVGGTSELGKSVAVHYAEKGHPVVITGREPGRAQQIAAEIGHDAVGINFDLSKPQEIATALADVKDVLYLVLVSISRDENSVKNYDIKQAVELVTLKLVGYPEVVHALLPHMRPDGAVLMYGGMAKERPYPGSTTVTSINGGVSTLVRAMSVELAPLRINAIHPGVVGETPYWADKPAGVLEALSARTLTGKLVTVKDVTDAAIFLLENQGVNGVNLDVDGGWF
ncbi:MAG: SDR family oxidoreductase [Anaerolineales bacterium]|nr:SDR family oxidoreductase [Anaerolineales bacterium]MCW5854866.1 SDR family oxidoreductase [Anaerolineales bacterium]